MGWQEIKSKYTNGETGAAQKTEDLVARRVLRGLGLTEPKLTVTERYNLGDGVHYDETLWQRTHRLLRFALQGTVYRHLVFETLEAKTGREIPERYNDGAPGNTVYLTRCGKTTNSRAYFLGDTANPEYNGISIAALIPPYMVQASIGPFILIGQEIEPFIKSLVSYEWKTSDD